MPRYDQIYETLANRAVRQGGLDIETFISQMVGSGVSQERVEELLLRDLNTNGPIFGKFMRSLSGAAEASVAAAGRQGELAGKVISDKELQKRLMIADTGAFAEEAASGDPDTLEAVETGIAEETNFTWLATFTNTCHLCLPLHGHTLPLAEWLARGLHPDTIHKQEGWVSDCYCRLEPADEVAHPEVVGPLVRLKNRPEEGSKINKTTMRSVLQTDLEKALKARDAAMASEAGRRTLRAVGQVLEE